jgi:RNA polymerase sigma-70 factor (ECF subfamily)
MTPALGSLLERARLGDSFARDAVYSLAFSRLRRIASALLRQERPGHTLQPTALVSELFLKLHRLEVRILNEDHFFRLSARAMRQVLIDHSRARRSLRTIPPELIAELLIDKQDATSAETRLAVKLVFEKLRTLDAMVAETVWFRAVHGMTIAELSAAQNREAWQVRADHDFGLQWMAGRLRVFA